ncbi:MAG: hypothetical protein Q8R47_02845 [Nanoarchaeota archaeon]|nr:hypothetical protein [Nanoarchaeota archaeon]
MIKKLINVVTGESRRNKQLVKTLDDFLANAKSNSLTDEQAKRNLEEGVVELVNYDGQHSSNGLLITDDGYFLTAGHCLKESPLRYVLHDGRKCKIEKVCAYGKRSTLMNLDIALAKAKIPGARKARQYRFYQESIKPASPVDLYCRWDTHLLLRSGKILADSLGLYFSNPPDDIVFSDNKTIPGDSGGVLATVDFEILSLQKGHILLRSFSEKDSYLRFQKEYPWKEYAVTRIFKKPYPANSTNVKYHLDLVEDYRKKVAENLK